MKPINLNKDLFEQGIMRFTLPNGLHVCISCEQPVPIFSLSESQLLQYYPDAIKLGDKFVPYVRERERCGITTAILFSTII